jgi:hypothetical protein
MDGRLGRRSSRRDSIAAAHEYQKSPEQFDLTRSFLPTEDKSGRVVSIGCEQIPDQSR